MFFMLDASSSEEEATSSNISILSNDRHMFENMRNRSLRFWIDRDCDQALIAGGVFTQNNILETMKETLFYFDLPDEQEILEIWRRNPYAFNQGLARGRGGMSLVMQKVDNEEYVARPNGKRIPLMPHDYDTYLYWFGWICGMWQAAIVPPPPSALRALRECIANLHGLQDGFFMAFNGFHVNQNQTYLI